MALLPIKAMEQQKDQFASKTLLAIDSVVETGQGRNYSGMSGIGNKCIRALQYASRNAFDKEIPARVNRIFEAGHKFEDIMIESLKSAGVEVFDEQLEVVGFAGHWKGHIDGKCIGVLEAPKTVHLAEFKTMKDSKFKTVVKKKVKDAFPGYYAQMQMYMHYTKLTRALFMAINKDTCDYYIERIHYDKNFSLELVRKSEEVFLMEYLSHRIGNEDSFDCRFCNAKQVCFGEIEINKNCRTCENVDIENEGKWVCGKEWQEIDTFEKQMAGCRHWVKAEFFI